MNVNVEGRYVEVILSERNLLSLLDKLYMPGSARTLQRNTESNTLSISVETDAEHYEGRAVGTAGEMHPDTEAALAAIKRARGA